MSMFEVVSADVSGATCRWGLITSPVVHDGCVRRLWVVVGIERQRVLSKAPSAAIIEAPESDSLDNFLVFLEDREEPCVIVCLSLKVLNGCRRCIAIALLTEATTKLS